MTDREIISGFAIELSDSLRKLAVRLGGNAPPIDPPPPPPIDPPPVDPPPTESEFMRAVVLRDDFEVNSRFVDGWKAVYGPDPLHNVTGKSWGLSVKLFHHAPPTGTSPLSLWDDSSPQWQLKVPGPTRLAVAFALTGGGYGGFDVVVDDLTGRWVHVVVGFNFATKWASIWIDGVLKDQWNVGSIGFDDDSTPPLIVNSTAASHAPGDISIDELVYAVGAAPTAEDVARLSGIVPHAPGPSQEIEGDQVVVSVHGPDSAKAWHDPKSWLDGRVVELKQTRNNPPLLKSWAGKVPDDIGREVTNG